MSLSTCPLTASRSEQRYQCDCSYQWLKNGVALVPTPWRFEYIGNGSLRITQLISLDEGYYQCLASNSYGTAMSSVMFLQRAVVGWYSISGVIEKHGLTEGHPATLMFQQIRSVPPPIYSWHVRDDTGMSLREIMTDARVQIDEYGEQS